jgi:peptidoglycan DL-endopeptidase CwlO
MRDLAPFLRCGTGRASIGLHVLAIMAGMALFTSCAPRYAVRAALAPGEENQRQAIVDYAASLVGTNNLRPINQNFKNDCSGFVNGVYAMKGRKIAYAKVRKDRSLSQSLFLTLEDKGLAFKEGRPNVADAVFFSNTYRTPYNSITHVGLVEKVGDDGTVSILHYASGKVARISMNLRHPDTHKDPGGRTINDYVRKDAGERSRKEYLAGALFHSFGDIFTYTEANRRDD